MRRHTAGRVLGYSAHEILDWVTYSTSLSNGVPATLIACRPLRMPRQIHSLEVMICRFVTFWLSIPNDSRKYLQESR